MKPACVRPSMWLFAALACGMHQSAMAAESGRAPALAPPVQYTAECASCHIAYPVGMLPAASWKRLMAGLDRHYGTDASLDPLVGKTLTAWLVANAGTYRRVREEPPEDRISRSAWFIREHDEVTAATWKLPAVRSASNCAACHTQAEKGDFNERGIRIPR